MLGGIGDAASVLALLQLTKVLVEKSVRLSRQVKTWRSKWKSFKRTCEEVQAELQRLHEQRMTFQISQDLTSIHDQLTQIEKLLTDIDGEAASHSNSVLCLKLPAKVCDCLRTPLVVEKLGEAKELLDSVKADIGRKATIQVLSRMPCVSTELPYLPPNMVGRERLTSLMDFLRKKEEGVEVRAVVICGEGGLGKTTLLNWALHEIAAGKDILQMDGPDRPRLIRAYVQVKSDPDDDKIKSLQSSIIHQLFGSNIELPNPDIGRSEIHKQISGIRESGTKLCLAIDDVWSEDDLKKLLPLGLGKSLPASSCILITTRKLSIRDALEQICRPKEGAEDQHKLRYMILNHNLSVLGDADARELFRKWAGFIDHEDRHETHGKLVDAVVPLCGGFPLALEVIGAHFSKQANGNRWEDFVRSMQRTFDEQRPAFVDSKILSVLQFSYDHLRRKPPGTPKEFATQEAFLDITAHFMGWSWDRVSCIVGEEHMEELRDACLIKPGAPQLARHELNYNLCDSSSSYHGWLPDRKPVVKAHDLVLSLGKSLRQGHPIINRRSGGEEDQQPEWDIKIEGVWAADLYNGEVIMGTDEMKRLTKLRVLRLCIDFVPPQFKNLRYMELDGCLSQFRVAIAGCTRLSVASLRRFDSDFSDAEFPKSLRRLYLHKCNRLVCLPASMGKLESLEVLHIHECVQMQHLPAEIGVLRNLRKLSVRECPRFAELKPSLLENLLHLEALTLLDCRQLKEVKIGRCWQGLRKLSLSHMQKLEWTNMGDQGEQTYDDDGRMMLCLPESIGGMSRLTKLNLRNCARLEGLPESMGNLLSLKSLDLSGCDGLTRLPESFKSLASTLRSLSLNGCSELRTLPESLGELSSLENLILSSCHRLQQLPNSLGELSSLQRLNLDSCRILEQLPESVGKLERLWELSLRDCVRIESLPESLAYMKSLRFLDVRGTRIRSFPGGKEIRASNYTAVWPSLTSVYIVNCEELVEFPEQIAKLVHTIRGCSQLKCLPKGGKEMYSLESLKDVRGCKELRELPPWLWAELLGKGCSEGAIKSVASAYGLTSLQFALTPDEHLHKNVLPALAHISRLAINLDDWTEESLANLNACTRLSTLHLTRGTPTLLNSALQALSGIKVFNLVLESIPDLQEIPDSISSSRELLGLTILNCSNLTKLPDNLSQLDSLSIHNCCKLTKLTDDQLPRLSYLHVSNCGRLTSFPGQVCRSLMTLKLEGFTDSDIASSLGFGTWRSYLTECSASFLTAMLRVDTPSRCESLSLTAIADLQELPSELFDQRLPKLESLAVHTCGSLASMGPIKVGMLSGLRYLHIYRCMQMRELPSEIQYLRRLQRLSVTWCTKLQQVPPEICNLVALQNLNLEGCTNLTSLPLMLFALPTLTQLNLKWCSQLTLQEDMSNTDHLSVEWKMNEKSENRRKLWRSLAVRARARARARAREGHQQLL